MQLGDMAAATPTNKLVLTVLPQVHAVTLKFRFPAEVSGKCAVLAILDQPPLEASLK